MADIILICILYQFKKKFSDIDGRHPFLLIKNKKINWGLVLPLQFLLLLVSGVVTFVERNDYNRVYNRQLIRVWPCCGGYVENFEKR